MLPLFCIIVDWIIAELLCLKQSGYGGRVRYLLKNAVIYVPMYGSYLATVSERLLHLLYLLMLLRGIISS